MRQVGLIIFLIVWFWNLTYSQNQCNCDVYKVQIKEAESNLDKKDFESFNTSLKTIKANNGFCKQIKLALSIDAFISQNEVDKADSIKNEFQKLVTKESCGSSLALFYCSKGSLFLKQNLFDSATACLIKAQDLSINLKTLYFN
ncbi:MAG: hypothetical protein IPH32_10695 [Bacteroidetes bacterium]|nr:hypothetical protein [Bacteroidota bacterium]